MIARPVPSPPINCPLPDEAATRRLAERLAELSRPGDLLALWGDLGAGKTTLARAFIRALTTPDEEVPSPTFTLVQVYDSRHGPINHFDLYRIEGADEVLELDWEDARQEGIVLVEWPDRLGSLLPATRLDVILEADDGGGRRARLGGDGAWIERLKGAGID